MAWRLARSLEVLRNEVNARYPGRPKGADGTIGDTAHSSRTSDHNPNSAGVVCALDLTEWVQGGVEMNDVLAEHLRASRDSRIKYVISDGQMFSSYSTPSRRAWQWGPYSGPNAHTKHVHISVHNNYDDRRSWGFDKAPSPPGPVEEVMNAAQEAKLDKINAFLDWAFVPDDGSYFPNSKGELTKLIREGRNAALIAAAVAKQDPQEVARAILEELPDDLARQVVVELGKAVNG